MEFENKTYAMFPAKKKKKKKKRKRKRKTSERIEMTSSEHFKKKKITNICRYSKRTLSSEQKWKKK